MSEETRRVVLETAKRVYFGEVGRTGYLNLLEGKSESIRLHKPWELLLVDQGMINQQTGEWFGTTRKALLSALGVATKPVAGPIYIKPTTWFDVDEVGMSKEFDSMVEQAEKFLVEKQAEKAGIQMVGANALPMHHNMKEAMKKKG